MENPYILGIRGYIMIKPSFFQIALTAFLALMPLSHAVSISDTPVGWASENGGTTGGPTG